MINMRTLAALTFGTLAISAAYAQCGCCQTHASGSTIAVQAKADKGVQKATIIVDNGFSPKTIHVKAGQPVQLTFDVRHKGCASTVVFKDLKITKSLTDGKKTVIEFTPKKAGTIGYACGMNMLTGSILVK